MKIKPKSVDHYLSMLPTDRREALEAVRQVVNENLNEGFVEGIQYGMIGWFVPHEIYPAGYHCDASQPLPFASLAAQKNHLAIYLMCIYSSEAQETQFRVAWLKTGKKLDMGKSCVRFKKLADVPLEVIGEAIARVSVEDYIETYESKVKPGGKRSSAKKKTAKKKTTKKKTTKKKTTKKKTTKKKTTKKKTTKKTTKKTQR